MRPAFAIVISVSLLATAGCLASGGTAAPRAASSTPPSGAPLERESTASSTSALASAPAWSVASWSGYLRAGAAYEAPAYVRETSAATKGAWSSAFDVNVTGAPQVVQVRLNWTAQAGEIDLMVVTPAKAPGGGERTFESGFASTSPLCLRIPTKLLAAGTYEVMAHSKYAVDAHLAFTVSTLGAEARATDAAPLVSATEAPVGLAGFLTGGADGATPPEPCPAS